MGVVGFILIAAALTGTVLLVVGLRRRRVGTTCHCAACDYTIVVPHSDRCPECGAKLDSERAILVGDRARRPRLAVLGGALVLIVLLFAGPAILSAITGEAANRYKPTWLLLVELDGWGVSSPQSVLTELDRRLQTGTLSASQIRSTIARILKRQADLDQPWFRAWGDFVVAAHRAGNVTKSDWQQFLEQCVVTETFRVRPRVREGHAVPYDFEWTDRGPKNPGWVLRVSIVDAVAPGGTTQKLPSGWFGSGFIGSSSHASSSSFGMARRVGEWRGDAIMWLAIADGGTILHQWRVRLPIALEFVTPPDDVVTPVERPDLHDVLKAHLELRDLHLANGRWFNGIVRTDGPPPMPVAFEVFVRVDDREWRIGSMHLAATDTTSWGIGDSVKDFPADVNTVDVIFRSSAEVARGTTDIIEFWSGEIAYENVPLARN